MSKTTRRHKRILQLCKNKQYILDYYLSPEKRMEIDEWCYENLNGSFTWYDERYGREKGSLKIGFHDETDLMAFILRWA